MHRVIYLLTALLLFSSCGDSTDFATTEATGSVPNQPEANLPLLLDASRGSVDPTSDKLRITLEPSEEVRLGEYAEGGTLTLEEFLAQTGFSVDSPRAAELEYLMDGRPILLPLHIESARQDEDGHLLLSAVERAELTVDNVMARGTTGPLRVRVTDTNGADLPGAFVSVVDSTGTLYRNATLDSGYTLFGSLAPGPCKVSVTMPGFRAQTYDDVRIFQNRATHLDVVLWSSAVVRTLESPTLRILP
jgi:hypothetical protein